MNKRVPKAIKEEILGKTKEGISVADASSQTMPEVSVLEHNRLRR